MNKMFVSLVLMFTIASAAYAEVVVFNTQTLKIHKPTCQHAQKCTKKCIKIEKQAAKAKGGVPCKVCGG